MTSPSLYEQLRAALVPGAVAPALEAIRELAERHEVHTLEWYVTYDDQDHRPHVLAYRVLGAGRLKYLALYNETTRGELSRMLDTWAHDYHATGHRFVSLPNAQRVHLDVRTGALTLDPGALVDCVTYA